VACVNWLTGVCVLACRRLVSLGAQKFLYAASNATINRTLCANHYNVSQKNFFNHELKPRSLQTLDAKHNPNNCCLVLTPAAATAAAAAAVLGNRHPPAVQNLEAKNRALANCLAGDAAELSARLERR